LNIEKLSPGKIGSLAGEVLANKFLNIGKLMAANVESIYEGMAFTRFSFTCFLSLIKDIAFGCCSKAMLL
jgi:hypothetical protein